MAGHTPEQGRIDLRITRAALPPATRELLDDYERHLRVERDLSAHTVRAYLGDIVSLVDFLRGATAAREDDPALEGLDVTVLRAWLANQRGAGAGRATLARRSAAARTFTAWARTKG